MCTTIDTLVHPIPLHYFTVYRFGLKWADSYFRFHHFLFIIHGFHGGENNHISIQAFFSDFKCADKHYFVLCQAFGAFYKNRMGDFSEWIAKALTSSRSLTLQLQAICHLGRENVFLRLCRSHSSLLILTSSSCSFHFISSYLLIYSCLCLCIVFLFFFSASFRQQHDSVL